uniref:Uncharacterized protein n=1 Tax=Sphaerodactylus townsendi TaxID=933632 RepID=A0ACB8GDW7_9SAUR
MTTPARPWTEAEQTNLEQSEQRRATSRPLSGAPAPQGLPRHAGKKRGGTLPACPPKGEKPRPKLLKYPQTGPYGCEPCGLKAKYTTLPGLARHYSYIHGREPLLDLLADCEATFKKMKGVVYHHQTCDRGFKNQQQPTAAPASQKKNWKKPTALPLARSSASAPPLRSPPDSTAAHASASAQQR